MTADERFDALNTIALELNAAMPTDVMLKGDGSIWATHHGNDGIKPRKLSQQEVLELLYTAVKTSERMCSI